MERHSSFDMYNEENQEVTDEKRGGCDEIPEIPGDRARLPSGWERAPDGSIRPIPELNYEVITDPNNWYDLRKRRDLWPKYAETLRRTGRYWAAARAVNAREGQAAQMRRSMPEFAELCEQAVTLFRRQTREKIEREIQRRALEGADEPVWHQGRLVGYQKRVSDRLLLALAAKHDPGYRHGRGGGTTVQVTATAQAGASASAAAMAQGIDPARLNAAQRQTLKAFVLAMKPAGGDPDGSQARQIAQGGQENVWDLPEGAEDLPPVPEPLGASCRDDDDFGAEPAPDTGWRAVPSVDDE